MVATWRHKPLARSVKLKVSTLAGWTEAALAGVHADAERLALHLQVPVAKTVVS